MVKIDTYIITATPFRLLKKGSKKALVISEKGEYGRIDVAYVSDFKKGDYICKSVMIGEGRVEVNYFKIDNRKQEMYCQNRRLENIFFRFSGTPSFPLS